MSPDPVEPAVEEGAEWLEPQSAAARAAADPQPAAETEPPAVDEPGAPDPVAAESQQPVVEVPEIGGPVFAPAAPAAHAALQTRPEVLIGGAFAGGLVLAKLLGRRRAR